MERGTLASWLRKLTSMVSHSRLPISTGMLGPPRLPREGPGYLPRGFGAAPGLRWNLCRRLQPLGDVVDLSGSEMLQKDASDRVPIQIYRWAHPANVSDFPPRCAVCVVSKLHQTVKR